MSKPTLLVNYVYYQPVGHAIEALRYTLGYHIANPDFKISLVVNKHTPYFLADLCPWIEKTYTVDLPTDEAPITKDLYGYIPKTWDYLAIEPRSKSTEYCPGSYNEYYKQTNKYFKTNIARGYCGSKEILYEPNHQLLLKLPKENLDYATSHIKDTKVKIGILFSGSAGPHYYPSIKSWEIILDALDKQFNNVSFYFFGKLQRSQETDQSSLSGTIRENVDLLLDKYPNSIDCFDIGLLNQLAMVQKCGVFISPHSGFGFAVLAAGTPWLTISGSRWPEYFYNGVPFYSVLPDPKQYVVYNDKVANDLVIDVDGQTRIRCYSYKRISNDLPKILTGADILINKKWSYEKCLKNHFKKMKDWYPDTIWSFDDIHKQFIKDPLEFNSA